MTMILPADEGQGQRTGKRWSPALEQNFAIPAKVERRPKDGFFSAVLLFSKKNFCMILNF